MGAVLPFDLLGGEDVSEELRVIRRIWAEAREDRDPHVEASALVSMAGLLLHLGDGHAADRRIDQAHQALERAGMLSDADRTRCLAEDAMADSWPLAVRIYEAAIQRTREHGPLERIRRMTELAELELECEQLESAACSYFEVVMAARRCHAKSVELDAFVTIGEIFARRGMSGFAERILTDGRLMARELPIQERSEATQRIRKIEGGLLRSTVPAISMAEAA